MVLNHRMPLLSVLSIQNVFLLYLELFPALLCDAAHCVPYGPLGLRFSPASVHSEPLHRRAFFPFLMKLSKASSRAWLLILFCELLAHVLSSSCVSAIIVFTKLLRCVLHHSFSEFAFKLACLLVASSPGEQGTDSQCCCGFHSWSVLLPSPFLCGPAREILL